MEIGLGLILICITIACALWIQDDDKKYTNKKQEK
jgi:hypothetical protein